MGMNYLDRDCAVQVRIMGFVNSCHAPLSDQGLDLIPASQDFAY
jgi:hypothetical protein